MEQLLSVLNALNVIKKNDAKKKDQEQAPPENKIFLDKEFVYETRDDVYIYRDNRTKKKGYYIRIYDPKTQKHWSKSLKTTNRMVAMTETRNTPQATQAFRNFSNLRRGSSFFVIISGDPCHSHRYYRSKKYSKSP